MSSTNFSVLEQQLGFPSVLWEMMDSRCINPHNKVLKLNDKQSRTIERLVERLAEASSTSWDAPNCISHTARGGITVSPSKSASR